MQNTLDILEDRKNEIDLYYLALVDIETISDDYNNNRHIFNDEFIKILKSNFILLLYNLVEATIVSGIEEIYSKIKNEECKYNFVIPEIKRIWSNSQFKLKENKNVSRDKIIDSIINDIINIDKSSIGISGNLNDSKIREICKYHGILYSQSNGSKLSEVRNKRNSLAHGISSFTECCRDLTINDLEQIKDEVLNFITSILEDMKKYHDEKLFLSR